MSDPSITHSSFTIERTYPKPPLSVFRAFADPALKRRWLSAEGREPTGSTTEFRVGGAESSEYRMSGGPLPDGTTIRNDTVYHDIVPDRRIVFSYTMTVAGRRISASLASVELLPETGGTRLLFTEQAAFLEYADGETMRRHGWQQLLSRLGDELAV